MRKCNYIMYILLYACCLWLCCAPLCAVAQTQETPPYVRVEKANVFFYSAPDIVSRLFALIPSYYLTVVGVSGGFYQVELLDEQENCAKLNGYVLIDSVTKVYQKPLLPLYPKVLIQAGNHGCKIYPAPNEALTAFVTAVSGQSMSYYGKAITQHSEWYYVFFMGYLGYCQADSTTMPILTLHTTPLTQPAVSIIDEPISVDDSQPLIPANGDSILSNDISSPIQATLIVLITLPIVVILIVIFAPSRRKSRNANTNSQYKTYSTDLRADQPRYFDDYL